MDPLSFLLLSLMRALAGMFRLSFRELDQFLRHIREIIPILELILIEIAGLIFTLRIIKEHLF